MANPRVILSIPWLLACGVDGSAEQAAAARSGTFDQVFVVRREIILKGTEQAPLFAIASPFFHRDHIYISDFLGHRIYVFDSSARLVRSVGGKGTGAGQFQMPYGVVIDRAGTIYVNDRGNRRVQIFDGDFVYRRTLATPGQNEQLFLRRYAGDSSVLLQGIARCGEANETCLFQQYDQAGKRSATFGEVSGNPEVYTWRAAVADNGTFFLANIVGRYLDILSPDGKVQRRRPFESPSHVYFAHESAPNEVAAMASILKRLDRETYTRIESVTAGRDRVFVQLQRMNPNAGEPEFLLDVHDVTGRLLLHGIPTPGVLHSSNDVFYFAHSDESGYGTLAIRLVDIR